MAEINLEKGSDTTEGTGKKSGSGTVVTININLLGYEVREEIEKSSSGLRLSKPLIISLSLIGAAILLNIISYLVLVSWRDEQAALKEELQRRKAELELKDKELTEKMAAEQILEDKRNILAWAVNRKFKFSALLEEIRNRTPANLWVNKIDISENRQLNLSGETFDHRTVALFLANLQDSPSFEKVVLSFTKKIPKIKIRDMSKTSDEQPKPVNMDVERLVTGTTKFSINCKIIEDVK